VFYDGPYFLFCYASCFIDVLLLFGHALNDDEDGDDGCDDEEKDDDDDDGGGGGDGNDSHIH
jgi:hypothetical protein